MKIELTKEQVEQITATALPRIGELEAQVASLRGKIDAMQPAKQLEQKQANALQASLLLLFVTTPSQEEAYLRGRGWKMQGTFWIKDNTALSRELAFITQIRVDITALYPSEFVPPYRTSLMGQL